MTGLDMEKTGRNLEKLVRQKGFSVKELQKLLNLSCPQPVYRWFKGKILPSVDHLLVLARLLDVPVEELVVVKCLENSWKNTGFGHRMQVYCTSLGERKTARETP